MRRISQIAPLGFLHEQSAKSFVLDICDLYRTNVMVPIAFRCVKKFANEGVGSLDREVRRAVSGHVRETGFVDTVIDDIKEILA
jgi:CRISPR-associated protein Cas1